MEEKKRKKKMPQHFSSGKYNMCTLQRIYLLQRRIAKSSLVVSSLLYGLLVQPQTFFMGLN